MRLSPLADDKLSVDYSGKKPCLLTLDRRGHGSRVLRRDAGVPPATRTPKRPSQQVHDFIERGGGPQPPLARCRRWPYLRLAHRPISVVQGGVDRSPTR